MEQLLLAAASRICQAAQRARGCQRRSDCSRRSRPRRPPPSLAHHSLCERRKMAVVVSSTEPFFHQYKCREIMTRADFMEDLDRANIISVDIHHDVRPDSMLILHAARQVCEEDGFDELLDNVRDRIDEIESLHRTREL
ncbi:unnamed protein product, partial [Mycena citricolor]